VAVVVDDVVGAWRGELSIAPGEVSVRLTRWLLGVVPAARRAQVVRATGQVALVRVRWQSPWHAWALVLVDAEHRVVVRLSRARAGQVRDRLARCGLAVDDHPDGVPGGPGVLAAQLQHRHLVGRPARARFSGRSARSGRG
jgi:hypothetical protein